MAQPDGRQRTRYGAARPTSRFRFDEIFDEDIIAARKVEEAERAKADAEAAKNAPPTYTLEQYEEARKAAHQQGRQEGMADAMAAIEQQTAMTLDSVMNRLGDLLKRHRAWCEEIHGDSIRLSVAIMRQLAPELIRGTELPQIIHIIDQAFQFLTDQPKVIVRVAAELEPQLKDRVHLMATRVGYEGEVLLIGDPELVATDCRISWAAGAVERSLDDTWAQIDELVERTLKGLPARSDPPSETPPAPPVEAEADGDEDGMADDPGDDTADDKGHADPENMADASAGDADVNAAPSTGATA